MENNTLYHATFFIARLDYKLEPQKDQHKYEWRRQYDLTPEEISDMLKNTKVPLEMGLTELHLTPIEYFFKEPGQEYITNHMEAKSKLILFSTEPITFKKLKEHLKGKLEFKDYKIVSSRTEGYNKKAPWHVYRIDGDDKKVLLDQYTDAVVINPITQKQVQPAPQETQGEIPSVFTNFCQPIQLQQIPADQLAAFFENCKNR